MAVASVAGTGAVICRAGNPSADSSREFNTRLQKAIISGLLDEKSAASLKEAGIDGIESNAWDVSPKEAEDSRAAAEKAGLKIHSVMRGWANFNNVKAVEDQIKTVKTSLQTAKIMGADTILLVPCRIGANTPQPWNFDIEFDKSNGRITRVVKEDNAPFKEYIDAHNQAADASRRALEKLIPAAENTGVVIALENVWNNMWVKPDIFAHFVRSFDSKWIRAYFDIGNHVKYAAPEAWISELGRLIAKCHIKDFKLNENGQGGAFVNIRDGSVNWPSVRKKLDEIGYSGWMTLEGSDSLSIAEKAAGMDLIIAGK